MRVWARDYNPFVIGGDVHQPIYAEIPKDVIGGPYDLGQGFAGFIIRSPGGVEYVVEERSGGVVGTDIEDVKRNIANCSLEVLELQVSGAVEKAKAATKANLNYFWEVLGGL